MPHPLRLFNPKRTNDLIAGLEIEPQRMRLTHPLLSRAGSPNGNNMADDAEDVKDDTTKVPDDGADDGQDNSAAKADDVDKLKEQNKKLFERAKKAEADNKAWKAKADLAARADAEDRSKSTNAQTPDPDELRLIARGLSDLEIEQLQAISKGKGLTLMESLKDPLFVSFQKDLKEQEKKEKAKLGGSNSSNQSSEPESPVKSGMTEKEHREAWNKEMKGK